MKINKGKVVTVRGCIDPYLLGITLPHEHILFDLRGYARRHAEPNESEEFDKSVTLENLSFVHSDIYAVKDNLHMADSKIMIKELRLFQKSGGGAIIDQTNEDMILYKKEPVKHWRMLRDISEKADFNIVACVGNYIDDTHPAELKNQSVDTIAEHYIDIINYGYFDSGVMPGQIGELGVGNEVTPETEKVLRAGAIASAETGLSINIHLSSSEWKDDFKVLDILKDEGADLNRVVLSHRDALLARKGWTMEDAIGHYMALMDRGAYVLFDAVGNYLMEKLPFGSWLNPSDQDRCNALRKLMIRGYHDRIMVSMDVSQKHRLSSYGGYAFSYITKQFHDICTLCDIPEDYYQKMLVDNPREVLTIV